MPECVDKRWRRVVGGYSAGLGDVFVTQRNSKQADDHVGQRRDDGENQALLEGIVLRRLEHLVECTSLPDSVSVRQGFC
jgi:hypothetical protein